MVGYVYLYIGYVKYTYNICYETVFYSSFHLLLTYLQTVHILLFAVHLKHPALLKAKWIINGHILLQVSAVSSYP